MVSSRRPTTIERAWPSFLARRCVLGRLAPSPVFDHHEVGLLFAFCCKSGGHGTKEAQTKDLIPLAVQASEASDFFCTIALTLRSSTQPLSGKSRGYLLALGGAEINMAAPRPKSDEATELPPPARMLAESACSTSQSPRRTRQTALVSCHGWSAKLKRSLPALRLYVFAKHP